MKNKTIEDQKLSSFAKKYFSNNFSELEPQTLNNLKNKVENNKQSRRKNFWLKLTYSTTALCCLIALCVILSIIAVVITGSLKISSHFSKDKFVVIIVLFRSALKDKCVKSNSPPSLSKDI